MPREDYYDTYFGDFITILRMAIYGVGFLPVHHSRGYHLYDYSVLPPQIL